MSESAQTTSDDRTSVVRFLRQPVLPGQVALHWFEQSAYALRDHVGRMILLDPYFPAHRPSERFIFPSPPATGAELPADYILLTHSHEDHTDPETLGRIRLAQPGAVVIGPPDAVALAVEKAGFEAAQTRVITAGQQLNLGGLDVFAVYAKPPEGDPAANIEPPDVLHLGYVVVIEGTRLYFSGDVLHTFAERQDLVAAVAALHPSIGCLTTHPTEGEFPFFAGSARMAQRIGLKTVVPAHYACFAKRTYDPQAWAQPISALGLQALVIPRNSHILYSGLSGTMS